MVHDRLFEVLENENIFADTMFGFRPHRSAQDVLLQLDLEILNPIEYPLSDKVVLGLDLKGAFDNIRLACASSSTRDDHSGRRIARAEGLACHYGRKNGVFDVDSSGPHHGGWYTAVVVHQNTAANGITFRAHNNTHAEEIAIALAAADKDSRVIITELRGACRNIEQGCIPSFACKILQNSNYLGAPANRTIIWALAHTGLEGNEVADAAARALTLRAPSRSGPSDPDLEPFPACSFKEVTQFYQSGHSVYPKPCRGLTKAEERILLRLYTKTLLCPAILKHFDPACTAKCPLCEEDSSDIFHMVSACQKNPNLPPLPNPSLKDWEAALLGCSDLTAQRAVVWRARAAADAIGLP
ncbi:uncharacterized protein LOC144160697 [Haemaphysalis longicornis]